MVSPLNPWTIYKRFQYHDKAGIILKVLLQSPYPMEYEKQIPAEHWFKQTRVINCQLLFPSNIFITFCPTVLEFQYQTVLTVVLMTPANEQKLSVIVRPVPLYEVPL